MEGVKDTVVDVKEQTKGFLAKEVQKRAADMGDQLGSAGRAVSEASTKLREEGNTQAAEITDRLASKMDSVANYLDRIGPDELLRDLEDFGRKQSAMLIAGGLLLGLAGSRFLKASSARRMGSQDTWGGPPPREM
ncbi:MAG: hypothetical protein QOE83_865 [Actinomycetota bacterium]|jgi:hypothetical protein|nr:hypothetical protein [Actinomycetota bacterium]